MAFGKVVAMAGRGGGRQTKDSSRFGTSTRHGGGGLAFQWTCPSTSIRDVVFHVLPRVQRCSALRHRFAHERTVRRVPFGFARRQDPSFPAGAAEQGATRRQHRHGRRLASTFHHRQHVQATVPGGAVQGLAASPPSKRASEERRTHVPGAGHARGVAIVHVHASTHVHRSHRSIRRIEGARTGHGVVQAQGLRGHGPVLAHVQQMEGAVAARARHARPVPAGRASEDVGVAPTFRHAWIRGRRTGVFVELGLAFHVPQGHHVGRTGRHPRGIVGKVLARVHLGDVRRQTRHARRHVVDVRRLRGAPHPHHAVVSRRGEPVDVRRISRCLRRPTHAQHGGLVGHRTSPRRDAAATGRVRTPEPHAVVLARRGRHPPSLLASLAANAHVERARSVPSFRAQGLRLRRSGMPIRHSRNRRLQFETNAPLLVPPFFLATHPKGTDGESHGDGRARRESLRMAPTTRGLRSLVRKETPPPPPRGCFEVDRGIQDTHHHASGCVRRSFENGKQKATRERERERERVRRRSKHDKGGWRHGPSNAEVLLQGVDSTSSEPDESTHHSFP
eukprot:scaffold100_cov323-Pavlova_lutheri.AAC.4